MEDKVRELLKGRLDSLNLVVAHVSLEKENNNLFLKICLDSEEIIDLDKVVTATNIINPIIDEANLIQEKFVLEVYGKSKGSEEDER